MLLINLFHLRKWCRPYILIYIFVHVCRPKKREVQVHVHVQGSIILREKLKFKFLFVFPLLWGLYFLLAIFYERKIAYKYVFISTSSDCFKWRCLVNLCLAISNLSSLHYLICPLCIIIDGIWSMLLLSSIQKCLWFGYNMGLYFLECNSECLDFSPHALYTVYSVGTTLWMENGIQVCSTVYM